MAGLFEVKGAVNASAGSKTLTILGANFDASSFGSGMVLALNNFQFVEAVSGTAPDSNLNSTITLKNNWENTQVSNGSILAFNSPEGLRDAIANSKQIADRMIAITAKFSALLQGNTPTIEVPISATEKVTTVPYQYLVDQFQSSQSSLNALIGSMQALTETVNDNQQVIAQSQRELIALNTIPDPICHLFAPNDVTKTLAGSLSVSRASTATYIDRYGTLKTAAIDELRTNEKGALIEDASTNLLTYSDAEKWLLLRVTRSVDATLDINKAQNAQKITVDNTPASAHLITSPSPITFTSGKIYTKSVVAEAGSGSGAGRYIALETDSFSVWGNTGHVVFDLVNGVVIGGLGSVFDNEQYNITNLQNGRYLCEIQMNCTTDSTTSQEIHLYDGGLSFDGNGADYIYIHNTLQIEELTFASSIIPTNGSPVTRAADNVSFAFYNNAQLTDRTISASVSLLGKHESGANARRHIYSSEGDTPSNFMNGYLYDSGDGYTAVSAIEGNSGVGIEKVITEVSGNFAWVKDGELLKVFKDGLLEVTASRTTPLIFNTLHVGSQNGSTRYLWGYIKNFRIFDKALTPDEIKLL